MPFGKLLTGNEGRDAFHQPMIPLIVDQEYLKPGGWVKKRENTNRKVCGCVKTDKNCIGYIDPYIDGDYIPVGRKVFIFLNQGLVNDMRHHFSSPFFDDKDIMSADDEMKSVLNKLEVVIEKVNESIESNLSPKQIQAKEWLQKICKENRLYFETFEKAQSISDIYYEVSMYVKLNVSEGEGGLEESVSEIYKNFGIYKNIEIDEDEDDLYYIDWDCMGCD